MALEDKCGLCEFWLFIRVDPSDNSHKFGLCRCFPPHVAVDNWPDTKSDGWCGEYKRKTPPVGH